MARPERTRRNLGWVGGGLFALVLVIASAFSCTRSEPVLRAAASRPTTTTTTTPAPSSTISGTATTRPEQATSPATTAPATGPSAQATPTTDEATTTPTASTPAPRLVALPARTSEVATVRSGVDQLTVYVEAAGAASQHSISATGDYGQRQVFLVLERRGDRLRVVLPVRPNGSKGWIAADQVEVASHDYQIQVSLSGFQMTVQRGGQVVIDTSIGVGTQDTPTVGGEFYTWVLLAPTNSGYGSYAYGLSGFSTLEQFAGGDGRMGIHGTADESSIGRNVSHGCVRVPDEVVVQLVEDVGLPLGVPVTVTA